MKNKVLFFPKKGEKRVFFDFGKVDSDAFDKVSKVMELLSNTESLSFKFKPSVDKFLNSKNTIQNTPFIHAYNDSFNDLIIELIKREIVDHFDFTPEDVLILTDKEFLNLITDGFYFNIKNYHGGKNG